MRTLLPRHSERRARRRVPAASKRRLFPFVSPPAKAPPAARGRKFYQVSNSWPVDRAPRGQPADDVLMSELLRRNPDKDIVHKPQRLRREIPEVTLSTVDGQGGAAAQAVPKRGQHHRSPGRRQGDSSASRLTPKRQQTHWRRRHGSRPDRQLSESQGQPNPEAAASSALPPPGDGPSGPNSSSTSNSSDERFDPARIQSYRLARLDEEKDEHETTTTRGRSTPRGFSDRAARSRGRAAAGSRSRHRRQFSYSPGDDGGLGRAQADRVGGLQVLAQVPRGRLRPTESAASIVTVIRAPHSQGQGPGHTVSGGASGQPAPDGAAWVAKDGTSALVSLWKATEWGSSSSTSGSLKDARDSI